MRLKFLILIFLPVFVFSQNKYFITVENFLKKDDFESAKKFLIENKKINSDDYLLANSFFETIVYAKKSEDLELKVRLAKIREMFQQIDEITKRQPKNSLAHYVKGKNLMLYAYFIKDLSVLKIITDAKECFIKSTELDNFDYRPVMELQGIYANIPAFISFSNKAYGVSCGKKLITLRGSSTDYAQLAAALAKRGWSAKKREKNFSLMEENYKNSVTYFDKLAHFEITDVAIENSKKYGVVDLVSISDYEEADLILKEHNIPHKVLSGETAWKCYY